MSEICNRIVVRNGEPCDPQGSITTTITRHIPVAIVCDCGRLQTICKMCGQHLHSPGNPVALRPWRFDLIYVGDTEFGKKHEWMWMTCYTGRRILRTIDNHYAQL